jgi:oxalate decarboxylase
MDVPPRIALAAALKASRQSRRTALRRIGGGLAGAIGAASVGAAAAQEWAGTPSPSGERGVPASLAFDLEASPPKRYAGGEIRELTRADLPALDGMALFSERIDPGGLREVHWHPNAGELNYVLSGQAAIGVFDPEGTGESFEIAPGSVTFIPLGYAHYIRNTGVDPVHLVLAFTHEAPETLDLSEALPPIPTQFLAETMGVSPATFPFLPLRGDQRLVRQITPAAAMAATPTAATTVTPAAPTQPLGRFSVAIDRVKPTTFAGGSVRAVGVQDITTLDGITVFPLRFDPHALREPHWHTNANELNYCVSGTAQLGIVAPDGSSQTFVVQPGAAAYIPANWFHYIANIEDQPLEFLVFFGNVKPNHIDLSQAFGFFPPEILAASFGLDPHSFASLPKRGDVFVAAATEATP